jgi:hypothetical protein
MGEPLQADSEVGCRGSGVWVQSPLSGPDGSMDAQNRYLGGFEVLITVGMEPTVRYHLSIPSNPRLPKSACTICRPFLLTIFLTCNSIKYERLLV